MALWAGNRAPDFATLTDEGKPLALADLAGQTTVFYFYPRADTAG
jgi:peroxiredoxin